MLLRDTPTARMFKIPPYAGAGVPGVVGAAVVVGVGLGGVVVGVEVGTLVGVGDGAVVGEVVGVGCGAGVPQATASREATTQRIKPR